MTVEHVKQGAESTVGMQLIYNVRDYIAPPSGRQDLH